MLTNRTGAVESFLESGDRFLSRSFSRKSSGDEIINDSLVVSDILSRSSHGEIDVKALEESDIRSKSSTSYGDVDGKILDEEDFSIRVGLKDL